MGNTQLNRLSTKHCKIQTLIKLLAGLLLGLLVSSNCLADFAVQVGVFQSTPYLERAKVKLSKSGFQVITQTVARSKTESRPLIRIMVGPFKFREEARRASRELNTLGWKPNFIRSISDTASPSTQTSKTDTPDTTPDKTVIEPTTETSSGSEIKWFGFTGIEVRAFQESAQYAGQHNRSSLSFVLQPELYLRWADRRESLTFTPFVRVDEHDDDRTHYDVRELIWEKAATNWEIRAGIGKVFWGVTESQHLVDIINQTDLVESPDGEDKLGQPMVNFAWIQDWGTIDLFVLPGFRERTFPGVEGRIRTQPRIDNDQRTYQSSRKKKHIDYAVRWGHSIGDWDAGLSHFYGTSRDPALRLGTDQTNQTVFISHYDLIHQTGLDVQATKGNWLWKLEAIRRTGQGESYNASTSGFEYTLYGIMDTVTDLGIVAEYLYDSRNDVAPTPLQDDYMLGIRFNFNDVQSTEALLGVISDGGSQARAFSLEASRRLGDSWRLGLEARAYQNFPVTDPLYTIRNDDYMQVDLNYYF
jgi:hypothetical protein